MRLIYNTKYPIIDGNMSDCQMGARKKKGCKNNIFMINGIIHEVMKPKLMKPVMLQIFYYCQMFDSINLKEALSDIYNAGVTDDTLSLLYKANTRRLKHQLVSQIDKQLVILFYKETLLVLF